MGFEGMGQKTRQSLQGADQNALAKTPHAPTRDNQMSQEQSVPKLSPQKQTYNGQEPHNEHGLVILPDSGRELLRHELALAFEALGYSVLRPHPDALKDSNSPHYLPRLLDLKPEMFFSVNLQGLFPGRVFVQPLLEAGVRVIGWFVDNPWNVLSAMRDPLWKQIELAVTDKSFIPALRNAGATKVVHMPLAACYGTMRQLITPQCSGAVNAPALPPFCVAPLREVFFAGRLAFPDMASFFSGTEIPQEAVTQAQVALERGGRADFYWWCEELSLAPENTAFWPGKKARVPALGAVYANMLWRRRCVAALGSSITVFGGDKWAGNNSDIAAGLNPQVVSEPNDTEAAVDSRAYCFDHADLRPAVDYYLHMPELYRRAEFSLNLNSLVLHQGLSQRIFDVWVAGGFCLTDKNAGLEIFPDELTAPVSFKRAEELPELINKFKNNPAQKDELRRAWEIEILKNHSYVRRLGDLLGV